MDKVLFYWSNLNKFRDGNIDQNQNISFQKNKNKISVDWNKYHVLYSKKWLLNDLLSEVNFEIIESLENCKNKKIIIIINDLEQQIEFSNYEYTCQNNKVFLFHIGDEFIHNIHSYLKLYHKSFFAFRQYYILTNLKNLMHIPLGYKTSKNFYKEKKKYFWSYCGTIYKSSRHDMIDVFKKNFDNYFFYKTDFFGDKKSLDADKMYKAISQSIFSLCPQGFYHPETYRVFEVLENNSIPIIQDSNSLYDKIFPENHFIKIKYWSEFLELKKKINYEEFSNSNYRWYHEYKKKLKLKIKKIIYE